MSDSWFGRTRTLDQQFRCLEPLRNMVKGYSILDVGCAEGWISLELMKSGAFIIHGVDFLENRVKQAQRLFVNYNAQFWTWDAAKIDELNDLWPDYDMVLLLAILHKLKNPEKLLEFAIQRSRKYIVVRAEPVFQDWRSGKRPIRVQDILTNAGLTLSYECIGTYKEWVGCFEK